MRRPKHQAYTLARYAIEMYGYPILYSAAITTRRHIRDSPYLESRSTGNHLGSSPGYSRESGDEVDSRGSQA
jgi:hypothetical protein